MRRAYMNWPQLCKICIGILLGVCILQPVSTSAESPEDKLLSDIIHLDAGDRSVYAVKADGSAWAWGGGYGSIGNGATTPAYTPVRMHIDHVKQISGGYRHSLILKDDGTVWVVGGNEHGQLGNGSQSTTITTEPQQVLGLTDVKMVSAGDNHSLALRKDGTVWGWGGNEKGQLGDDSRANVLKPVQVKNLPNIVSVAAGMYVSAALGNGGEVWIFGLESGSGGKQDLIRKPTQLQGNGEYFAIALDQFYGTGLRYDGTVWMWQNQTWVQPERKTLEPFQVRGLTNMISISTDMAVKADGTVWQWKLDDHGNPQVSQVPSISNAISVTSGGRNHYVLLKDGHVMSWGTNEFGQTGLGVLDFEITHPQMVKKSIAVFIDGQEIEVAMPPIIVNGSTYVPLRGIFQQMDVDLRWDIKTRSVIAADGATTIVLNSLTGVTTLNDKVVSTNEKPIFVNDSVYVPLRLVTELLGAHVEWDAAKYAVRIDK